MGKRLFVMVVCVFVGVGGCVVIFVRISGDGSWIGVSGGDCRCSKGELLSVCL